MSRRKFSRALRRAICEACDAPVVTKSGSLLTWDAVPYAICYVITKGDEVVSSATAGSTSTSNR